MVVVVGVVVVVDIDVDDDVVVVVVVNVVEWAHVPGPEMKLFMSVLIVFPFFEHSGDVFIG